MKQKILDEKKKHPLERKTDVNKKYLSR